MFPLLTQEEILRYSRHLMIPGVGLEGQRKLKAASVLLVGVGGLGSSIALYLAAAGVGRIGLVDYDVVDTSNLQRQVIHSDLQIDIPKVDSARQRMLELNPFIHVDTYIEIFNADNAKRIAGDYDILVDGSDNLPSRYLLNDLAVLTQKPYVYGSVFRFEGQMSVFDARYGPCYRCLFPEPPDPGSILGCADGGVLGVVPGTIGLLQATEVIKLIVATGTIMIGKLLLYDASELSFQIVNLRKNPNCKICGPNASIHELVDYEAFCGSPDNYEKDDSTWNIEPRDLAERIKNGEKVHLIDVRDPVELQVSCLPGAEVVSFWGLQTWMTGQDPSEKYVVFCRTGRRSQRAAAILQKAGFTRVWSLRGGINAWAQEVDPTMLVY